MFNVTGTLENTIHNPATDKYEETFKVQLLGQNPLVDGQFKLDLLTLNVPRSIYDSLKEHIKEEITLPVGFYVKNGQLITFYPKHAK
jgi:hypothetical protein